MQQARLDDVEVLSNITLPDDDLVFGDFALLHGVEHARLLLFVKIAKDKVVRDGCFDTSKLFGAFGIDGDVGVDAPVDDDGLCAYRRSTGKYGRCRRVKEITRVGSGVG
jgi:hypothetical protein